MARKWLTSLDLNGNELLNARIQNLATAPASPVEGQIYYDTTLDTLRQYNGTSWIALDGRDLPDNTITSAKIANGTIVNEDISGTAAIALAKLATDPLARANHTGTQTAATISDFDTQVRTNRLDQMAAPTAAVDFNSQRVTGVADPTAATDAANKRYVDTARQGADFKEAARVATQGDINLAAPGATIDGVTLAAGERVLVKAQTAGEENGIYTWTGAGTAMTRTADADTAADIESAVIYVQEGTNADQLWALATNAPFTLGTTALVFTQIGAIATINGGAGLTRTGDTIDIVAAATTDNPIIVNADSIDLGTVDIGRGGTGATTAAAARTNLGATTKYAVTFGDGAATTYTITHNLGTTDVTVQVYQTSDGVEVYCDVARPTTNTVTLGFGSAVAANALRCVVVG